MVIERRPVSVLVYCVYCTVANVNNVSMHSTEGVQAGVTMSSVGGVLAATDLMMSPLLGGEWGEVIVIGCCVPGTLGHAPTQVSTLQNITQYDPRLLYDRYILVKI